MEYIVIIISLVAIVLVFLVKFYNLSIIYPTLLIILAVMLNIISNMIKNKKQKNDTVDIKEFMEIKSKNKK